MIDPNVAAKAGEDRDRLLRVNAALVEALKGVRERVDGSGESCWCIIPRAGALSTMNHGPTCVSARAALKLAEPAPTEEKAKESK